MKFQYNLHDIKINSNEELSLDLQNKYIVYVREQQHNSVLKEINLMFDGDDVDVNYMFEPIKPERIRRITGYLVGTVDRFNDGKKAEEHDRVKHSV